MFLREQEAENPRVNYLSFSRNFGKEAAMFAGLEKASGDYVVIIDADLQDPPELIIEMYETLQTTDYDCVASRRVSRKGESGRSLRECSTRSFGRSPRSTSWTEPEISA